MMTLLFSIVFGVTTSYYTSNLFNQNNYSKKTYAFHFLEIILLSTLAYFIIENSIVENKILILSLVLSIYIYIFFFKRIIIYFILPRFINNSLSSKLNELYDADYIVYETSFINKFGVFKYYKYIFINEGISKKIPTNSLATLIMFKIHTSSNFKILSLLFLLLAIIPFYYGALNENKTMFFLLGGAFIGLSKFIYNYNDFSYKKINSFITLNLKNKIKIDVSLKDYISYLNSEDSINTTIEVKKIQKVLNEISKV
ncbi:hypothetical protein [Flavobacterium sp.]|uniref:hypothetical protein n=1 Tax=Flavobacterium sp. TaxID=239 RepID=UPI0040473613